MAVKPANIEVVSLNPFIDPRVINSCPLVCVVGEDGVSLEEEATGFKLNYALAEPKPEGLRLRFDYTFRDVELVELAGWERYKSELEQEKQERAEASRLASEERERKQIAEAAQFNASLNLPFAWAPDIKVVMSGLSENSWGNGADRRTVEHVRVLESFQHGRLKREKGDFLCGKDKSKHQGYTESNPADTKRRKVTCSACLKVAKRFRLEGKK